MIKLFVNGFLGVVLLLGLTCSGIVTAKFQSPLLMAGKKTLYQRVLARPEAYLHSQPTSRAEQTYAVAPFTIFYVYERKRIEGVEWVKVGHEKRNRTLGWIPADRLIDWKQTLTVAFKDPLGHDRVLLFKDRESLRNIVEGRDLFGYELLYRKAAAGEVSEKSPVIAIQPKAYVDVVEDFYLVPITQHEDVYIGEEQGLLLQVATLPKQEPQTKLSEPKQAPQQVTTDYRSAIVFVIDSTISMGPYIDRTREAVHRVYDSIERYGLKNKVSFGLIAYRDNLNVAPGLEYLTRTYASLQQGTDPRTFFTGVDRVGAARVSSKGYIEDAYAGVKKAIEDIDWSGYRARYVVLITDAGARPGHDPLGQTGLNAEALRQLAFDKNLSIWTLHLRTPEGRADHSSAEEQYRRLSHYPQIGELYYPVELGSVTDFGRALEAFASQIAQQVRDTAQGLPPALVPDEPKDSELAEFQRKVSTLGYALRMRYLQKAAGGLIPEVFNAWLVDRDIAEPERKNLEVRVLLTRDQLSDLQHVLKKVMEATEEGVFSPSDFLDELKSVAATISRDPAATGRSTRVAGGQEQNLADLGYMREYIEDLPYKGEVMNLSLQTWEDWPAKEQLKFLHRLESKINYYQTIHDNTDLWISLDGGPVTGDSVFPVALEMLP